MDTAIVLFTRDLRLHDNPALAGACARARQVVPLFVVDPALTVPPNRARFLADSLAVLQQELRQPGGDLVIRTGDPVAEVIQLATQTAARAVFIAGDVSGYAARREQRLARECGRHRVALEVTPGHQVVPAGDLQPAGGDGHYRVFTPYWRAWHAAAWREPCQPPEAVSAPVGIESGDLPIPDKGSSAGLMSGGEWAGRDRATAWLDGPLKTYGDGPDLLASDETSRLSAYLRFGCVSPLALAREALPLPGGEEFCRQLAWRDFFHQVTAAFPDIATEDYRPGSHGSPDWAEDPDALDAWRAGRTGIPVVDAGMRQLIAEGFMHNRARMITASFLTRTLGIDWRHGYRYFRELLADGDVACNAGNWQWVAGTGNNPRPGRVLNPLRQAARFDHDGDYVRRYVPELASLAAPYIHTPWKLPDAQRRQLNYPDPLATSEQFAVRRLQRVDTLRVSAFDSRSYDPDRDKPAEATPADKPANVATLEVLAETRSRGEVYADTRQAFESGWERQRPFEAPHAELARFRAERAGLPETSQEEAARYLEQHRTTRPWLEVAGRATPESRRIIAAIDQGAGHGHIRHEGSVSEEANMRRVTYLEDPAQLDVAKQLRGIDGLKPNDKRHVCAELATRITGPDAFATAFARGAEHSEVRAALSAPYDRDRRPEPVRVPIAELLGKDGHEHCTGWQLEPVSGSMDAAIENRMKWRKALAEGRQPDVPEPMARPIPTFEGGTMIFVIGHNKARDRYEITSMYPQPRDDDFPGSRATGY